MRTRLLGASMLAIFAAQGGLARAQTPAGAPEEIIVTASKRSEKLQKLPQSVQVLDTKVLAQQNVNDFQDFVKLVPSLSVQTAAPNQTTIYLRGVVDGGNANHSGPLPLVGSYLDEQPVTTIGGTLDVHVYDIARIEVLPGPQGTLYGASSEAGTVRMITNKPTQSFSAGYSVEGNGVSHGGLGDVTEGFVNVPLTDHMAVRIVAFQEHDAGYIDNVPGTLTYTPEPGPGAPFPGLTIDNANLAAKRFNPADTIGGRAALKIDLNDSWTVTPTIMGQDLRTNGIFGYEPGVGDLQVQRYYPDTYRDKWAQAGLTVNGKIGNYDLTYAGSLFVRDVHQRIDYTDYTVGYQSLGYATYYLDANGNAVANPSQYQDDKDHFNKVSNEIRLASPATDRLRFIVGGFQELQTHRILQDYLIAGLGPASDVPGRTNTIWLTDQSRRDLDYAAFTEVSYDILPQLTITAGVRAYYYDNSLKGYFGLISGTSHCLAGESYDAAPCVNLDKSTSGSGETHKINISYKIDDQRLVYFTYSTGFRPGGINRKIGLKPYQADYLTNFEVGIKSSWLDRRLTLNAAAFDEDWNAFQFAFLTSPSSFTIVENAPSANIKGLEAALNYRATSQLTVSGSVTLTDARLVGNFCGADNTGTLLTGCTAATAIAVNGAALPYTPAVKGSATARYNFTLANDWDAHVQGTASYQSHSQVGLRKSDIAVLGFMPSFATFDISGGIEHKNISLELFVKNVADERGQQNRYIECNTSVCSNVYVVPVQPRTIGLRLSQKF